MARRVQSEVGEPDLREELRACLAAAREAADRVEAEGRTMGRALLRAEALMLGLRHRQLESLDVVAPDPPPARPEVAMPAVLNAKEVAKICGLSRSTIWRLSGEGRFPKRHRLTEHRVGWMRDEVEGWIAAKRSEQV